EERHGSRAKPSGGLRRGRWRTIGRLEALDLTSPRLRGEVGTHRRCVPGEGELQRVRLLPSARREPLTPTLSPRRAGRGGVTCSVTGLSEISQSLPLKIEM